MVTFLMTDIVGSTTLWDDDPAAASVLIDAHDELVAASVDRAGGTRPVEQGEGDSLLAAFERATDAASCALDIQAQLAATGGPVVRAAIHLGEVEVRHDGTYRGAALNRCARLRAAANGGQILVSRAVHDVLVDNLSAEAELIDLGLHRLRGLARAEHVWELRDRAETRTFPLLTTTVDTPHNLPTILTSFVGRQTDLDRLAAALDEHRLVTITGSGGGGKTRIAAELGSRSLDRWPDGVWFVDLAATDDPGLVDAALASVIGVSRSATEPLVATLARHLGACSTLIVLDNCEHLVDPAGALASAVLASCPNTTVLATSREPLGVLGEMTWRLPSLSLPSPDTTRLADLESSGAARLFVERARTTSPGFEVREEDVPALTDICRRLDGIPLALELAASRTGVLSLSQIASALDDRFRLLTGGRRNALPRQRTLEASVAWSHELLDQELQAAFRLLSVFAGSFDLDAAVSVCGDNNASDVLDLLTGLVDRSLVQVERRGRASRYRMLETIRDYARRLLVEDGAADDVRDRHLAHFAALAVEAGPGLDGPGIRSWLTRIDDEVPNLRAALDWSASRGHVDAGLLLVGRLGTYWASRSTIEVGSERLAAPVAAAEGELDERVRALCALMWVAYRDGNVLAALAWASEAVEVATPVGGACLARALAARASIAMIVDDIADEDARTRFADAVEAASATDDPGPLVQSLHAAAAARFDTPESESARPMMEHAASIAEANGMVRWELDCWWWIGNWEYLQGDVEAALERATTVVDLADELAEPWFGAIGRVLAAWVHMARGELDDAAHLHDEIEALVRRHPTPLAEAYAGILEAELAGRRGDGSAAIALVDCWSDQVFAILPRFAAASLAEKARLLVRYDPDRARVLVAEAERLPAASYFLRPQTSLDWVRGRLLLLDGRPAEAETRLRAALDTAIAWGYKPNALEALETIAQALASLDRDADALRVLGACRTRRSQLHLVDYPDDAASTDALADEIRNRLDPADADTAWNAGRAMTLDDLVLSLQKGRGTRARPAIGWESLTPTETRVVELVAEGLTNPQIGERMHISRRTVQTHVSHVFTKLDMNSRTELAAAASRRAHSPFRE